MAERTLQAGFWLALIVCTYLALAPSPPDPIFRISDVVLHGFAFATLTFGLAISHYHQAVPVRLLHPNTVKPALWMLGYGVAIELIQSVIPERTPQVKDVLVDMAGILVGLIFVRLLGRHVVALSRRLLGSAH